MDMQIDMQIMTVSISCDLRIFVWLFLAFFSHTSSTVGKIIRADVKTIVIEPIDIYYLIQSVVSNPHDYVKINSHW